MSSSTPPYVEPTAIRPTRFWMASRCRRSWPRARRAGHAALALTDHNSLSGSIELSQAADECGVRAIHGAEIDLDGGRHITLLVRDERGWRNLCRIITLAHAHTREGVHRRERAEPSVDLQAVLDHAEGLICLTGCAGRSAIGGRVPDSRRRPGACS